MQGGVLKFVDLCNGALKQIPTNFTSEIKCMWASMGSNYKFHGKKGAPEFLQGLKGSPKIFGTKFVCIRPPWRVFVNCPKLISSYTLQTVSKWLEPLGLKHSWKHWHFHQHIWHRWNGYKVEWQVFLFLKGQILWFSAIVISLFSGILRSVFWGMQCVKV